MHVFWSKGYDGTSLDDLTEAMGINRPSLYAAFGNKEQLFQQVLKRYTQGPASYVPTALAAPSARDAAEAMLRGAIDVCANPDNPGGCLLVQCALAPGESPAVRPTLEAFRKSGEMAIRTRLEQAVASGELPTEPSAETLARYLTCVVRGVAVLAASGASRDTLNEVVDMALCAWPTRKVAGESG